VRRDALSRDRGQQVKVRVFYHHRGDGDAPLVVLGDDHSATMAEVPHRDLNVLEIIGQKSPDLARHALARLLSRHRFLH